MNKSSVAIVMPVYNEEAVIKESVTEWVDALKALGIAFTLYAINDGSRDKTKESLDDLAKNEPHLKVLHKENEGHGATILRGYEIACETDNEWVFQTDSDAQFYPEDFVKLWNLRDKFDLILGFRAKRNDPFSRIIITTILKVIIFLKFRIFIKDANCPYRLMKRGTLKTLLKAIPANVFAPNIFLSIIAATTLGGRFGQIEVRHRERTSGKCSIRHIKLLKCAIRSLKEVITFSPPKEVSQ